MKRLSKFFIITLLLSLTLIRSPIMRSTVHNGVDPGPANGQSK